MNATMKCQQNHSHDGNGVVHHVHLSCEAWDLAQQAREILAREGITVESGQGPCIAIERYSRLAFAC